ncbi:MAG: hypothetical protein IKR83_03700 [Bacteroidales bacterium]|jgi:hypothetical protein|nr:hypothetical protein [Bacteroidales bacterium]
MKKRYIKPTIEVYLYQPEKGFAWSQPVALHADYVLIEGDSREDLMVSDEVTEYTEENEYTTGSWGSW